MQLHGKTALITGASSGIGAEAALLFANAGARVVLGARRQARLDELVCRIESAGGHAVALAGDVSDEAYAEALVDLALSRFDRLDVGFNNAGQIGEMTDITQIDADAWHRILDVNLTGAFFGAKHQIAAMQQAETGSVIFTSSFVGYTTGFPGMAAYAASKAGVIGLTRSLATEVGPQGIRVNALLPGGTETEMVGDFSDRPEARDQIAGFHALKRMAKPEEIAKAALFLASDAASFVTGSAFFADGGNSICKV